MLATISTFGWFHTVVSVSSIVFGLAAFYQLGKIDPRHWTGRWYLATMYLASVTSFGVLRQKGLSPGLVLTLLTLALLAVGTFATRLRWFGRAANYVQTVNLSASFLLLMVFATTETLTRTPAGHPFASGPDDPALLPVRLALLVTFLLGVGYQVFVQRSLDKQAVGANRVNVLNVAQSPS